MRAAVTPMRFLPCSGSASVENAICSSSAKGAWKGARVESIVVPPGGSGCFALRIRSGLVRLGWLGPGGSVDDLGTDEHGFGFGGTGRRSHARNFTAFGEPFGAGDVIRCELCRSGGRLKIEFVKNGKDLGLAFDLAPHEVPQALLAAQLVPAVCGRQFEAELIPESDGLAATTAVNNETRVHVPEPCPLDELAIAVHQYLQFGGHVEGRRQKQGGHGDVTAPEVDLRSFFMGSEKRLPPRERSSSNAIHDWVLSALAPTGTVQGLENQFQGCADVRSVSRTIVLPSGPTLHLTDSQPADRRGVDRAFLQNLALWASLPRGHCEVREGGPRGRLLHTVVGLRKFGDAEEKYGALARDAGGSRRAALTALPSALAACRDKIDSWRCFLVFLTKENGEMCKVSFFKLDNAPYLLVGSKNVVLAVSASSHESALSDLQAYSEERYGFAVEMIEVFLKTLFCSLNESQRSDLIGYVSENDATLCGESISPEHQHIQSYRGDDGGIVPEIRFFAITGPHTFETGGHVLHDPVAAQEKFLAWGLKSVEACDEALADDHDAVRALERKHLLLPNREGAVVYAVLRPAAPGGNVSHRTAIVYKWKNAWYVTVRALREKFTSRASEARIWKRIRQLHVHHPDEEAIVHDFLGFYRWSLALLPLRPAEYAEVLSGYWVSLKTAYDIFLTKDSSWSTALPSTVVERIGENRLLAYPSLHAALVATLPQGLWVYALCQHWKSLDNLRVGDGSIENAVETMLSEIGLRGPGVVPSMEPVALSTPASDAIALTVVLVRGLQGSGKSSLSRALCSLLGGRWVNQDEEAAKSGSRGRGAAPRERFLQAVADASADSQVRFVCVDKIHTLRRHRDEVKVAVETGFVRRAAPCSGRVAVALFNLAHPDDDEGDYTRASMVCLDRVTSRGLGHLSFLPQATDAESVIFDAGHRAEALDDDEKVRFDLYADLDLTLSQEDVLKAALGHLESAELLHPGQGGTELKEGKLADAIDKAHAHEKALQGRWQTLYWSVALTWEDILWDASCVGGKSGDMEFQTLREALSRALSSVSGPPLQPIDDPHVTLLWIGQDATDDAVQDSDHLLAAWEGKRVGISIRAVVHDASLGLVALRVSFDGEAPPCHNVHAHITTARRAGVAASRSNDMLQRKADGDNSVVEARLTEPVRITGVVSRQLAPEAVATLAGGDALPEAGNPICDLGLVSTSDAVDIWATYDGKVRWTRLVRTLNSSFCRVTEPLNHCRGWPPQMRGRQWFTFHESPFSAKSLSALRELERQQQLQTMSVAIAYVEIADILPLDKGAMQAKLVKVLAERGSEVFALALKTWRDIKYLDEHMQDGDVEHDEQVNGSESSVLPRFYVQCKSAGDTQSSIDFRQGLAASVAALAGWEPVIKNPDVTLSAFVQNDWILLGLVIPRSAGKQKSMAQVQPTKAQKRELAMSMTMTKILRHAATKVGVAIRPDGFCSVEDLLRVKDMWQLGATVADVEKVVRESDKRRFELSTLDGVLHIRACQGHSMEGVEDEQLLRLLRPEDDDLPQLCVHGTYQKHLAKILSQGLLAGGSECSGGGRNHIHFAPYERGDKRVISGMRHDCDVAIYVDLRRALTAGVPFFLSTNEVILSPGLDGVLPPQYIEKIRDIKSDNWLDMGVALSAVGAIDSEHDLKIDGSHLEGGGQLLRNACALSVLTGRSLHISNVRGGRSPPGLRASHATSLQALAQLADATTSEISPGSRNVAFAPPSERRVQLQAGVPLVADIGSGGSVALVLQTLLPVLLAQSALAGGTLMTVQIRGGTNVAPPPQKKGPYETCAPQVDYVQLVLFPMLRKLFGVTLDADLQSRGFLQGGGEICVRAAAGKWPLPPFVLVDPGDTVHVHGVAYRSDGVPAHVLPRFLQGSAKGKQRGAAVTLQSGLPDVPTTWEQLEVPSVQGGDGCGVIVVVETSEGCLHAGDSVGRRGAPAETVGEEAASAALRSLAGGGCCDVWLVDQLVIFMAIAAGTSRLRIAGHGDEATLSLHAQTALWLVETFGASWRLADGVLEVDGIGERL